MKMFWSVLFAAIAIVLGGAGDVARADVSNGRVVNRLNEWISPEFRRDGQRLEVLEGYLADLPELLKGATASRYGFRSETLFAQDDPQWVLIDLGREVRIDRLALVPVHIPIIGESGEGYGFPLRFKIEVGNDPELSDAVMVADFTAVDVPNPGRRPMFFQPEELKGRYLRVTSTRHFPVEDGFIWALEEIAVISNNLMVAVNQRTTASSSLELFPNWSVERINDGMSSLGLPVTVEKSPSYGYLSAPTGDQYERKWLKVDFGREYILDEIRLLPIEEGLFEVLGNKAFPRNFIVEVSNDPDFSEVPWSAVRVVSHPVLPSGCALVIQAKGARGRYLRLVTRDLWGLGNLVGYGFAEIQAYSGGENVALGKEVSVSDAELGSGWAPEFVVNGFSSRKRLVELPEYFDLIEKRGILEQEQAELLERRGKKSRATAATVGYGGGGIGMFAAIGWTWLLIRQRKIQRQAVALLRDQIARDLHDDIGSNLGGILLMSEIGGKQSSEAQARADFQIIREAAEEASASMHDIVWLIERGHFGLRDLVRKMRQSTQIMVGDKEVALVVEPADFKDRDLSLLFRRHVFFAFKEALNNVRKHANAGKVNVRVEIDVWHLKFIVEDNGLGFDPVKAELPGHGLSNLRRRSERLRGSCLIKSEPGGGSVVTFSAPLKS